MSRYKEIMQGKLYWLTDYVMMSPVIYYRRFYRDVDSFHDDLESRKLTEITQELVNETVSVAFGNLIDLYMNSKLSSVQFKGMAAWLDNCESFTELCRFIGLVGEIGRLSYSVRETKDQKKLLKDTMSTPAAERILKWNQRLIAKYNIQKLDERKTEKLFKDWTGRALDVIVDSYMDHDKEFNRAHIPESKKLAQSVPDCTDELANEAACIADTPGYTWRYYVCDKLIPALSRRQRYQGDSFYSVLAKKDTELINKAYIRVMLSQAAGKRKVSADEIAKFLVEYEKDPLGIMDKFQPRMEELGVPDVIPNLQNDVDRYTENWIKMDEELDKEYEKEEKKMLKKIEKGLKKELKKYYENQEEVEEEIHGKDF